MIKKKYICKRCGKIWQPRITTRPKRCPKCKSPYWYKERERLKPDEIFALKDTTEE